VYALGHLSQRERQEVIANQNSSINPNLLIWCGGAKVEGKRGQFRFYGNKKRKKVLLWRKIPPFLVKTPIDKW
jgi:hypothetical protein